MNFTVVTPPNSHLYRIEEREDKPAKAHRSLIGTYWHIKQFIYRVGYEWEPMDFEYHEVYAKAKELLKKKIASPLIGVSEKQAGVIVDELASDFGERILPIFRARGQLCFERRGFDRNPVRTFWYTAAKDGMKEPNGNYFVITGIKRCLTGRYYPASGGGWGYEDWEDYEPAGLSDAMHHTVYKGFLFCDFGCPAHFTVDHFEMWGTEVLVHPLDLVNQIDPENPPKREW